MLTDLVPPLALSICDFILNIYFYGLSLCCRYWAHMTSPAAADTQALLKSKLASKDDGSFVVRAPQLLQFLFIIIIINIIPQLLAFQPRSSALLLQPQSRCLKCFSTDLTVSQIFKLTRCICCVCAHAHVVALFIFPCPSFYCDSLKLSIWGLSLLHRLSSLSTDDNSEDAEDTNLPLWLQWLTLIALQVRANSWWVAAV